MTSNSFDLPDSIFAKQSSPSLDAAFYHRCERVELEHSGGVSMQRAFDPVSQTHWIIRSAPLSVNSACERLRREVALAERLDAAWALLPSTTIWTTQQMICVYPATMDTRLAASLTNEVLSIPSFIDFAVGLTRALGEAHARGMAHGDMRPANIVVESGANVRLIGFGYSSGTGKEFDSAAEFSVAHASMDAFRAPYLAPEIILGLRSADAKKGDTYALGVTLYSMLTGTPPFEADTAVAWQHAHIAIQPLHPHARRPDVPPILGAILLKLMAKDPGERYSTISSALADLLRCRLTLQTHGHIEEFPLDVAGLPMLSDPASRLFGRSRELESMDYALRQVTDTGMPGLVFIQGAAGAGKSALVETFSRKVQRRGLRFASGQARQAWSANPFAPAAQAIRSLTTALLGEPDATLEAVRADWVTRLSGQGRIVAELVPEVEWVIGSEAPLSTISAEHAQTRAIRALLSTFAAFARRGSPLVLFFDDLQWADASTLALVEAFATEPSQDILLILACREEDDLESNNITKRLTALKASMGKPLGPGVLSMGAREDKLSVRYLEVHTLTVSELAELIGATLNETPTHVESLAHAVHRKTGGNPFFSRQLLRELIDDGVLAYDGDRRAWAWSHRGVEDLRSSDNVIDLMVGRFGRLPSAGMELIQQLACVGSWCATALLAQISNVPFETVREHLKPFIDAGLLVEQNGGYAFQHDRVLESAYSLVSPDSRPAHHAHIAFVMIGYWGAQLSTHAFVIADQIARANGHPSSRDTEVEFARVLVIAGQRARNAAALSQATTYVNAALQLAEPGWWSTHYALVYAASLLHCECLLTQANLPLAEREIDALLDRPLRAIDKAAGHRLKAALQTVRSDYQGAISAALSGLALLDVHLPLSPTSAQMHSSYESVQSALRGRPISSLDELPVCGDRRVEVVMGLLSALSASFFIDEKLALIHLAKIVELTLEHGVTPESPYGLAWFGVFIAGLYDRSEDGLAYGLAAISLVDRHRYEAERIATLIALDQVSPWTRPLGYALGHAQQARKIGRATGDVGMACYACNHIASDLLAMGVHLALVEEEISGGLELIQLVQYRDIELILAAQLRFVRQLRGHEAVADDTATDELNELTADVASDAVCAANSYSTRFFIWLYDGMARLLYGDYNGACERLTRAEALTWAVPAHISVAECYWFCALADARAASTEMRHTAALATLRKHRERFAKWAKLNPLTFRSKLLLVDAEIARLSGSYFDALTHYEQSAEAAALAGFAHDQALAHEFAGALCETHGLTTSARQHLRAAQKGYLRWGAQRKAVELSERHPALSQTVSETRNDVRSSTRRAALEWELGAKTAKAMSREVMIDRLIETLMTSVLVHAGAQYGALVLMRDGSPHIEAAARVVRQAVEVTIGSAAPSEDALPLVVLNSVIRTREALVLADAAVDAPSLGTRSSSETPLRSVLCQPLERGGALLGVIYLENNLAPGVFDTSLLAELEVLAPQIAISLETARLYEQLIGENNRRVSAEVSLRSARAELARTSHITVMGNLAASIAHEVNQPLTAITASVDASVRWLNRAKPDLAEVQTGLANIKYNSVRAAEIIRALRSLAKQAPSEFVALNPNEIIRDVLELVKLDIDAQRVRAVTRLDAAGAIVEGDRVQLQQVILNLVTNALEAMNETPLPQRILEVTSKVENREVVVTVRDYGPGITPDALEQIFAAFFTTKSTGMGMGLAICRSIIEAHHGSLIARSDHDGAELEFRLPVL